MNYERPVIQRREVAEGFLDLLVPRNIGAPAIDWRAKKLKEFIDTHPGTLHVNLETVCQQLGLAMSGRQARRLFKESVRIGFREYGKNTRLAFAAEQLQKTDASIKAIAIDAGYHNPCHFARSFKDLFRLSPLEFRRMWRRKVYAA
jgi:transcriptional regulator GlxA family with amidase domain